MRILSSLLVMVFVPSLVCLSCVRNKARPGMSESEILSAITQIDPWSGNKYTEESWKRLLAAAEGIRDSDPEAVERAIAKFIKKTARRDDNVQQWSKVFLLLRVMFELPEDAPQSDAKFFGGWLIPNRVQKVEGSVNLAWPIEWNNGDPRLVAPYSGYQGTGYLAQFEYAYYLKKYPFRRFKLE